MYILFADGSREDIMKRRTHPKIVNCMFGLLCFDIYYAYFNKTPRCKTCKCKVYFMLSHLTPEKESLRSEVSWKKSLLPYKKKPSVQLGHLTIHH